MGNSDPWDFSRFPSSGGSGPDAGNSGPSMPESPPSTIGFPTQEFQAPGFTSSANPVDRFGADSAFGADPSRAGAAATQVGPPAGWLAGAFGAAVIGLVVAALSLSGGAVYIAAWAVAGPVALGMLTIFARQDAARQTAILYNFPTWKPAAYRAALALSFVAVVLDALRIADWAGHL